MITERVRALLHRVVAKSVRVPPQATPAADPEPVQLLEPTLAQAALGAGQAPATGTRVVEVDAGAWVSAAPLVVMVRQRLTGRPCPAGLVEGGGWAEDVVEGEFDIPRAWRTVVMVQVIVGAHYHGSRRRKGGGEGSTG